MIFRCILPKWIESSPNLPKVVEGEFTDEQVKNLNESGYNIYFLPNSPSIYVKGRTVDGSHIDTFSYVFVDMDLKDGIYESKQEFLSYIDLEPTMTIDSGNGIHVYWAVSDLDAISYLKLSRRMMRKLETDEAVGQIYQLMRYPGTINTKNQDSPKECVLLQQSDKMYTCEDLDKTLPLLTQNDEEYCKAHFDKTYNLEDTDAKIDEKLPLKFAQLLKQNQEVKDIWVGNTGDRSKSDFRLAHIMFASEFTKEEALSVLVNAAKALSRAPKHRVSYASNIVDQIWTYELASDKSSLNLSFTVKDILERKGDTLKGTRFRCHSYIDATHHGFRLGQVVGVVGGSGVGKTTVCLNMFEGFAKFNPDYDHFIIPLEQPPEEIADTWKAICGEDTRLHSKVHILSNYDENGGFRHLSLAEIKDYLLKFQSVTGKKIGCVVIDHIGALKKKSQHDENQGIMDICHEMKAFAVQTNTLLIMQSQTNRSKAGIGDLELDKDAAYGTVFFESYCDYLITLWQPLKRCYAENGCPTVMAFKFCKIRHKKQGSDAISEDVPYRLFFDPESKRLREMTQSEDEKRFSFWNTRATNKRKADRKSDVQEYKSTTWVTNGTEDSNNKDKVSA